jgi:hypothetical protein
LEEKDAALQRQAVICLVTDEVVTQEYYEAFLLQNVVLPLKMLEVKTKGEKQR